MVGFSISLLARGEAQLARTTPGIRVFFQTSILKPRSAYLICWFLTERPVYMDCLLEPCCISFIQCGPCSVLEAHPPSLPGHLPGPGVPHDVL